MWEWPRRFFSDLYGRVLAAQFTQEQTEQQARVVARALRLRKGMRVLDIPCGFGRLTLPLARRGLAMTGVDLTESYVRKARRSAEAERLDVRFLAQDMRRIEFHEEFDAAFNWFTSFGYYSDEENLLCLRRLHEALRPGGRLLIETMNLSWILPRFRPRSEQTIGGVRIVSRRRYDARNGCICETRTNFYRGRWTRCSDCIRLYTATEMRRFLRKTGFADIRLYGHNRLEDSPSPRFTRHSRRLIAVARRRVLDVGCGAGRVALYLQSRGLDVIGIDTSPLALKVCKARGVRKVKRLPFDRISPKLGVFDTVVMFGNNFGLFGSFAQARRLLRRLHDMTTSNARILGSTRDPYQTTEPKHLANHRRNRARGRMGGQIRIRIRYENYATPWFDYLLVSKKELAGILSGTSWQATRYFDTGGGMYVAVIEKTKEPGNGC